MLRIIRARKSGKRFVGCQGWSAEGGPQSCDQTFPLPQRGDVYKLEERCSVCDQTPRLKVVPFRGRPWDLCLNDDCPSMQEMKRRRAEREAAREAKKAMEAAEDGNGDSKPRRKPDPGTTATRRRRRTRTAAKS
jgi:DNA topoisomerase-1